MPDWVLNAGLGAVKLNCLLASAAAQLIEVKVIGGAGSILIVLPDGWAADADRLSKSMGSKTVKVPHEPAPGKPLLVFHGSLGLGSFKVRPPSNYDRHRAEKNRRELGR